MKGLLGKANQFMFCEPVEFCDNPLIPDAVREHFRWDLDGGEEGRLPVDRISLVEYLGLLELGSHYYREAPLIRLYRQLEGGLRIHDAEGRKALYHGFKMKSVAGGKPVLVDASWPTLYEEGVTDNAELGRFHVRCEDVAGYVSTLPPGNSGDFNWRRQNGGLVSLRAAEHVQERFIGFQATLHILRRRFDKPGHEVTPGEIAIWLSRGFIRARTGRYSCAWEVDYSHWVAEQRRELAPEIPNLEDCLQPLFFDADELERLHNPERYLSYAQLAEREGKRGLSESAIIAALSGDGWFRQDLTPGYHPAPLSEEEFSKLLEAITHPDSGLIRRFLPDLMYPLTLVEEWELREALPDYERPGARESALLPGSIPTPESTPQAACEDHQEGQPARHEPSTKPGEYEDETARTEFWRWAIALWHTLGKPKTKVFWGKLKNYQKAHGSPIESWCNNELEWQTKKGDTKELKKRTFENRMARIRAQDNNTEPAVKP